MVVVDEIKTIIIRQSSSDLIKRFDSK